MPKGENKGQAAEQQRQQKLENARLWWGGLQESLNAAGCEMDLTAPEDTSRLMIFDINKKGPDNYEFKASFALDPDMNNIDYLTVTREDIMSRQKNGQVTDEMILRMYDAANSGLLYALTPSGVEVEHKPRPVFVGQNGLPVLGNDIDHMTPEESVAIAVLDEPVPPNDPGEEIRKKALEGDRDAKRTMNSFYLSSGTYNRNKSSWDKAMEAKANDPVFYQKNYNLGVIMQQYYGNFWDEGVGEKRTEYTDLQNRMHKEYVYSKLTPEQIAAREHAKTLENGLWEHALAVRHSTVDKGLKEYDDLNDEVLDIAAALIVDAGEIHRAKQAFSKENAAAFRPITEEERRASIEALRNSEDFIKGTGILTVGDITGITLKDNTKSLLAFADKFKAKVERNAALVNEEAAVKPLFNGMGEELSHNEALWKNLEDTLNAAGYEIDFNSPEDLARLVITDIADGPGGRKDVSMHYATDPQHRTIDQENITKEEILARQKPGVPDIQTLNHIRQAADEGRLFIQPHMAQKNRMRVRQVRIAANNTVSISSDIDELAGDELKAARMTEPPVEPQGVTFGTKFLAFFGNSKAKQAIADYNTNMTRYRERSRLWDEIQTLDRKQVTRTHNFLHATQGLFFANGDEGDVRFMYDTKLTDLHKASENRKLGYFERRMADEADKNFQHMKDFGSVFLDQYNARILPGNELINDINAYNLAGMIVARKNMIEAENHIILKDADGVRPKSDGDLYDEIGEFYKSEEFSNMRKNITNSMLADITDRFSLSPYTGLEMFDRLGGNYMPAKAEPRVTVPESKKPKVQKDAERAVKADISRQKQLIAKGLMALQQSAGGKDVDPSAPVDEQTRTVISAIMVSKAELVKDNKYLKDNLQEMPRFKTDKELASDAKNAAGSEEFTNIAANMTVGDVKAILEGSSTGGVDKAMTVLGKVYTKALKKSEQPAAQNDGPLIEDDPVEKPKKNPDAIEINPM